MSSFHPPIEYLTKDNQIIFSLHWKDHPEECPEAFLEKWWNRYNHVQQKNKKFPEFEEIWLKKWRSKKNRTRSLSVTSSVSSESELSRTSFVEEGKSYAQACMQTF